MDRGTLPKVLWFVLLIVGPRGKRQGARGFSLFLLPRSLFLVLVLTVWGSARGEVEKWVWGNEQRPWNLSGDFLGVDVVTAPRVIRPRRVAFGRDLLKEVRLFIGSSPSAPDYQEGDARIWTPHLSAGSMVREIGKMIDDDPDTLTALDLGPEGEVSGTQPNGFSIYVDLGAPFPVNRLRFYSRPRSERYLRAYELYVNDGAPENLNVYGAPIYRQVRRDGRNRQWMVDITFPIQYVRYIRLKSISREPFEMAGLEVYGQGFLPRATYTSKVIDFGAVANLGRLSWSVQNTTNTAIIIRTRSGRDPTPRVYYSKEGHVLSEEEYSTLDEKDRGSIKDDLANWSPWSDPYSSSGEEVLSPVPRRYFQFKIALLSSAVQEGAEVDSLVLEVAKPPIAHELLGKISPQMVRAGETVRFSYTVLPTMEEDDTGFDGLEIATPVRARFHSLKIGEKEVAVSGDNVVEREDRLTVRFPDHRITEPVPLVLTFDGRVLVFGTLFAGRALDIRAGRGNLPQRINMEEEGDLSVELVRESIGKILGDVWVQNNPMTPNGDGVNDVAILHYALFGLSGEVKVDISIYDLSGTRVKKIYSARESSRVNQVPWDGKDKDGDLVPPGVYIYHILVVADAKSSKAAHPIVVTY